MTSTNSARETIWNGMEREREKGRERERVRERGRVTEPRGILPDAQGRGPHSDDSRHVGVELECRSFKGDSNASLSTHPLFR